MSTPAPPISTRVSVLGVCALTALVLTLAAGAAAAPLAAADVPARATPCERGAPRDRASWLEALACRWASPQGFGRDQGGMIVGIMSLAPTHKLGFLVAALASAATLLAPPTGSAAELSATPATLDRVFASASGGDTIRLASGDYGTFDGSMKSGMVTLTPQPGSAVRIGIRFDPAANITLDGVTLTDAVLADGATHNIVIRNSDVPGQVVMDTRELANANILLEHNVHHDFDKCDGCGEGRVFLPGSTGQPSGITIRGSEFRGGLSDGIQNGSNGTQILNNDFHDIEVGSPEGVHSDAVQLIGSSNTVIRGNYFHDLPNVPAIMAPDGADHELIEDNVIQGDANGYPYITLFSDDGSIIRHNTFADGDCTFNLPCGILRIGAKEDDDPGRGTVVTDNIVGEISIERGSLAQRSHNLLAHDRPAGRAEIAGRPTYVGGRSPNGYDAFALAPGSRGKGKASDGLDIGARITDCQHAKSKVKRAKKGLRRARKRLRHAGGPKQTQKAKAKVKQAKRKLRRVRKKKRLAC